MNLSSTIKSIQDIMRKDDGVDGDAQRIGQLTWMLFLKIFDQCEESWEDERRCPSVAARPGKAVHVRHLENMTIKRFRQANYPGACATRCIPSRSSVYRAR